MGNVPTPFSNLTINSRSWSTDGKLIIYKVTSLSACIVGTAVYLRRTEPYFGAEYFGILMPSFITGYMLINVSEVFALYIKQQHVFMEVSFAVIGAIGSAICGLYQMYTWIEWIVDTFYDEDKDYGILDFVLAAACLINSASLTAVIVHRALEKYRTSIESRQYDDA